MDFNTSQPFSQSLRRGSCPIKRAVETMAETGTKNRGAIYTRREIVDFILDLIGYTSDRPLYMMHLLEPSFGEGDFLIPVVERLFKSWQQRKAGVKGDIVSHLKDAIRAVELHKSSFNASRDRLFALLTKEGLSDKQSKVLAAAWLIRGDFLLTSFSKPFTHVVGNPPYIRQELLPDTLMEEYRKRFSTVFDRADIYIPFFEKSLSHLQKGGTLGFICSDRWIKNRYGGPLRQMIAEHYHFKIYVDMFGTQAFLTDVTAYPAITVIVNEKPGQT